MLRNDLDLMCNTVPDELFYYETIVSDPREYNRLCTHISQGQLHIDKFLEKGFAKQG